MVPVVDPERPVGGVDGQGLVVGVHVINGFHLPGGQVVELVAVVVASIPADQRPGSVVEDRAVKGGKDFALFGAGQVDELVLAVFRPEAGPVPLPHTRSKPSSSSPVTVLERVEDWER